MVRLSHPCSRSYHDPGRKPRSFYIPAVRVRLSLASYRIILARKQHSPPEVRRWGLAHKATMVVTLRNRSGGGLAINQRWSLPSRIALAFATVRRCMEVGLGQRQRGGGGWLLGNSALSTGYRAAQCCLSPHSHKPHWKFRKRGCHNVCASGQVRAVLVARRCSRKGHRSGQCAAGVSPAPSALDIATRCPPVRNAAPLGTTTLFCVRGGGEGVAWQESH